MIISKKIRNTVVFQIMDEDKDSDECYQKTKNYVVTLCEIENANFSNYKRKN